MIRMHRRFPLTAIVALAAVLATACVGPVTDTLVGPSPINQQPTPNPAPVPVTCNFVWGLGYGTSVVLPTGAGGGIWGLQPTLGPAQCGGFTIAWAGPAPFGFNILSWESIPGQIGHVRIEVTREAPRCQSVTLKADSNIAPFKRLGEIVVKSFC